VDSTSTVAEIRLIRGLSSAGRKLLQPVLFPTQLFRGYAASKHSCFSFAQKRNSNAVRNRSDRGTLQDQAGGIRLTGHPVATSRYPASAFPNKQEEGRAQAMGFFSKDIKTLDDLFVHTLRDIYYAEKQIEKALPKMIDKATNPELKAGFEKHLQETKGHIERVEQVFEMHGVKAKAVNCPAIDGIIEEADEIAGDIDDKQVLDAALIASAQAVEHYEMTRYGTLMAWAKQLGRSDCAAVLAKNLKEEDATDKKLSQLGETKVNMQAAE
jgi:ferritin-like metal-binding protein YciE